MTLSSKYLQEISERGYLHQCTNLSALDTLAREGAVVGYIGYDATAPSLHVGNLVSVMMLRRLQQHGCKPIILLGGGTTRVGDPSGKDEMRKMLSDNQIEANKNSIAEVFSRFLEIGGKDGAVVVDNAEWLLNINYLDFLRDYGPHFTINRMLTFDSVKLRLEREQPLTFLEFNYMLLQAYDFVELNRRYGCRLQMGGSDQWGNIVNGVDLGRRLGVKEELFGLTTNLITTKSGKKMGKSEKGAVWLREDMLSIYDYWQFWRNTEDDDVIRFLKLFTDVPMKQIEELSKLEGRELNEAKELLADEATTMCHGAEAAHRARATAYATFNQGAAGEELPVYAVSKDELEAGIPAFRLFAMTGIAESNGEARRLVRNGGASVNNIRVEDENQMITLETLDGDAIKLSSGKKKHLLVKVG
jgi:tyrosyl-tRNA synthetase